MVGPRRYILFLLMLAVSALTACGPSDRAGEAPDVERGLERGRQVAASWITQARMLDEVSPETAVAVGYLERLRLGLGSPFRLIDHALNDPRLSDTTRVRLAWALLARIVDRQAYQIEPAALDRAGLAGVGMRSGVGHVHLDLIEDAIVEAPDPRGGEMAVRLAYALAGAEARVGRRAPALAAQAAALIRDREIARADAIRLIHTAESERTDPIRLVPEWRAERRFEVERPPLAVLPLEVERNAMELAPRLAAAIRSLGARLGGGAPLPAGRLRSLHAPLLGSGAARVLDAVAESFSAPPQTPVVIAVEVHRREVQQGFGLSEAERALRRRFIETVRNEERLAAQYARLAAEGPVDDAAAATVLAAAVGLRTYAQEKVWFPGYGGPTVRELEDRFGLAFVRFDAGVPAAWRPYFRRMLTEAIGDLQRVLPSLDLSGLGIRFGDSRNKAATLAIHDPARRTIVLPPETGAGTIAHEIAHDLDWQVALRRYRVRGDYGSDRATRNGHDRLAQSIQRLTTATLRPPMPGDRAPLVHGQRPAEVFARSVDWFVVVSLAREGRVNGYLSSAQDDLLTGYGTVTQPDISGDAGQALVGILDEVAPIYPATRDWFLRTQGRNRALTPYDLVRQVIETAAADDRELLGGEGADTTADSAVTPRLGAAGASTRRFAELERTRDAALHAIDGWICRAPAAAYDARLVVTRRRLVAEAAAARARGLAFLLADDLAGVDGRRWLAHRFYGAPWPSAGIDPATIAILDDLADDAQRVGEVQMETGVGAFPFNKAARYCTAAPLLAAVEREAA